MYTNKFSLINVVCVIIFCIDRITKYIAQTYIDSQGYFILKNFYSGLGLKYVINENVAFSIAIPLTLIYLIVFILLVYLFYLIFSSYKKQTPDYIEVLGLTLIIYGALSNIYDRVVYHGVIDFVHVFIWPVFNIADVMITIGVVLWAYKVYKK